MEIIIPLYRYKGYILHKDLNPFVKYFYHYDLAGIFTTETHDIQICFCFLRFPPNVCIDVYEM